MEPSEKSTAVSLPSGPQALEEISTMSGLAVRPPALRMLPPPLPSLSAAQSARRRFINRVAASLRVRGAFPFLDSTPSVRPMEAAKER